MPSSPVLSDADDAAPLRRLEHVGPRRTPARVRLLQVQPHGRCGSGGGVSDSQARHDDESRRSLTHVLLGGPDAAPSAGPHYLQNASLPDDAPSGQNTMTVLLNSTNATGLWGASVRSWLVDYDRALSVVVHNASGARILCGDLAPNMPSLPDVWTALIEANIAAKGYTTVSRDYYHRQAGLSSSEQHSALGKVVTIKCASGGAEAAPMRRDAIRWGGGVAARSSSAARKLS